MPRRIRYAVVGAGNIAQVAVLPAFAGVRHSSELVAVISSDAAKRDHLRRTYGISHAGSYDDMERVLDEAQVDAVYVSLPNSQHRSFTERAARLGVHVLCEKPMAVTAEDCEAMIAACRDADVLLMIAYRLHFEAANLEAVSAVESGRIGEAHLFTATLTQQARRGDIRTRADAGGGALLDTGVYPINAARYLFRDEPEEVFAYTSVGRDARFGPVDSTAAALLRFPGDRLAQFVVSQAAAATSAFRVIGARGHVRVANAFDYQGERRVWITADGRTEERVFPEQDQFGPELEYFSRCILEDRQPEPSGREGLADVRIVEALLQSARTGRPVRLPRFEKRERPEPGQQIFRSPQPRPDAVNAPDPAT